MASTQLSPVLYDPATVKDQPLPISPELKPAVVVDFPYWSSLCLALNESLLSIPLVNILMVPPTEGMANFEEPNPLCVCIVRVTALRPNQLLQYTVPFSMSFTGIPSSRTPTKRPSKPRILISASPSPPPCCVA